MGNTTAKRQLHQKFQQQKLDEFKTAILSAVEDNWKEEWKVEVRELVEQIEIEVGPSANKDKTLGSSERRTCGAVEQDKDNKLIRRVRFRNAPELEFETNLNDGKYQLAARWIFRGVGGNIAEEILSSRILRERLGLTSQVGKTDCLPYNLWNQVLNKLHTFCLTSVTSVASMPFADALDLTCLDSQIYLPPQHYSSYLYHGIFYDRGWV